VGEKLRFLDLFAGIGGFRLALEQAGHECIGFCEIDKFARQTYKANFNTEGEVEWHDITKVTDRQARELRGKVDLITGGFPCQAFSIAGERRGFEDTRGTLFFEIARITKEIEPRYLLLENVKGLLSHDKGRTFGIILNTLDELGFDCEWQLLNSKDFGVPQNRERVFIIGHSRRFPRREIFPITGTNRAADLKIAGNLNYHKYESLNRVYSVEGSSPTVSTSQGGHREPKIAIPVLTPDRVEKRQNGRRFKEPGEPMFTLTAQDRRGVLINRGKVGTKDDNLASCLDANYYRGLDNRGARTGVMIRHTKDGFHLARNDEKKSSIQGTHVTYPEGKSHCLGTSHIPMTTDGVRIRRLTPLETFRLQGFPDEFFHNAKAAGVSDSQLYKQAGNAVTVNVVYEIARRL
jgi:DNA (cytosine-5)-methyltransferase 1